MNWQLFSVMWSIASTVAMGVFIVIALVLGYDNIPSIIIAVIAGVLLAIPIAYVLANKVASIQE